MHAYDVPHRQSYPSIPSGRSAQDGPVGPSATPIYDALYAEYVKSFRTLPGDRSGEEKLGFAAFGILPHGSGTYGSGAYGTGSVGYGGGSFGAGGSYSAYSAGANSARHGGQQGQWQRVGQLGQHGTMHHIPAALPPAPRRGM
ncbi:hypothetical protein ACIQAC_21630 [Streptomyces sp. NPDC088387]|uniref:hypothetical protein n=1 Tax=Streptomyces sp. NPDC088387 TaxID=3365859 RepID=UPI0037F6783F